MINKIIAEEKIQQVRKLIEKKEKIVIQGGKAVKQ